jgi:tetratricopeptide (TPR) repeat protein
MSQRENLLQQCTVKLTLTNNGWGTGFFVAPGWILTCAHVVKDLQSEPIQVRWQQKENWAQAMVQRFLPDYDLALLKVTPPLEANPPCVYLDESVQSRDHLHLFGYPDQDFPDGCPVNFSCDGLTGDDPALIKFALGQVRPGMSGSPLLNQRTGKVCGIVKFTREKSLDLGGGAVTTSVILNQFPELVEWQKLFHQKDQRWNNLVGERLTDKGMIQKNFDDTTNYQIQAGSHSNTFISVTNNHNDDPPQKTQTIKKILMLSANPDNNEISRRRAEVKEIRNALGRANNSDGQRFDLEERLTTSATDISQEILEVKPYIINISGHENGIEGVTLQTNPTNNTSIKSEELIADLFKHHAENIKCIILNGCYSESQAREIIKHIEFIIGISQDPQSEFAITFLDEFYYFLGTSRSIKDSYNAGCNKLQRIYHECNQLPVFLDKHDEVRRRDLEKKLISCDSAIETNKNNVKLWAEKADLLRDLGRLDEANDAFKKASLIQPEDNQNNKLEQFGNYDKAVDAYEKALAIEDTDYNIWWKKGKALFKLKKYSEAVQSYNRALALNPPSPNSYVIYREHGLISRRLEEYKESIISYKKSLSIEPKYRTSNYEKKQVYKKMYFGSN